MGRYKEQPKYNVISFRVSDEEKAILDELSQRDRTTITSLLREAFMYYTLSLDTGSDNG